MAKIKMPGMATAKKVNPVMKTVNVKGPAAVKLGKGSQQGAPKIEIKATKLQPLATVGGKTKLPPLNTGTPQGKKKGKPW